MSRYELVLYGDPALRRKTEPVEEIDDDLRHLVDEMFRVMFEEQGIGLAAPQVGVSKRVFVIDIPSEDEDADEEGLRLVAINPEIVSKSGSDTDEEGCLSIPGVREKVTRPGSVVMHYIDLDGDECEVEASGLFARALQHELDHLEGILFIDKISSIRRSLLKRHLARIESGDVPKETA